MDEETVTRREWSEGREEEAEIGRVEKSGLVVSERRESEEKETSALGFGEREREREPKSDTWRERVREPLGCVHLNT